MKLNYLIASILFLTLNHKASSTVTVYDEKNLTIIDYDDYAAAFGPRISDDGFKGYIMVSVPEHACSQIESPPNISYVQPDEWIALIMRTPTIYGNCSFDVKVHNAQLAGFKAAIVYNSESDDLLTMSSSGKYSIKIPSVFVGHSSGIEMKKFYTYKNQTFVIITSQENDLSFLIIPFVCIVSICFLIAVSIFLIKLALHCHKIRKNRFPRSALKKIPTKKYQKTDKYDTCPICLNEYEEGVKMRILPCEHAYHIECIDKWLLRNNRCCPVCKRRVLPGDPESESDSESGPRNPTTHSIVENAANEDDDTNESSRLLISNRDSANDNHSICTTSTVLVNNNQNNNDISSLNNQMTISMNSNQLPSNKEMRSSSKYGSISSINKLGNLTSNGSYINPACVDDQIISNEQSVNDTQTANIPKKGKLLSYPNLIDSKASPDDYHTPTDMNSENNSFTDGGDSTVASGVQPGTSSSPYVLNVLEKNFQLKKVDNSKKINKKSNSFNENEKASSINSKKKSKNSKNIKPIPTPINNENKSSEQNVMPQLTDGAQQSSQSLQSDSDNLEIYASCKEDLNSMDQITVIQPSNNMVQRNSTNSLSSDLKTDTNSLTKIV